MTLTTTCNYTYTSCLPRLVTCSTGAENVSVLFSSVSPGLSAVSMPNKHLLSIGMKKNWRVVSLRVTPKSLIDKEIGRENQKVFEQVADKKDSYDQHK